MAERVYRMAVLQMSDAFPENLRFLCSRAPSIAAVCRRLGLNRQQFNKYLSGDVRPSAHNMRLICDFFGVTESELHMHAGRFSEIVSLRKHAPSPAAPAHPMSHIEALYKCSASLERYVGYYFRYYYSFSYPAYVTKSLGRISEKDGRFYWNNIEYMSPAGTRAARHASKYKGAIFYLADRIFVIEYHSLLKNSITEMILYPAHHTRISHLIGIQTGAPSIRGRKPAASRVLLEFLGKEVVTRRALRTIGLFAEDSQELDPTILELIRNRIPAGSHVLEVREV
jgi:transcriptional regulator with XRE-family HTH domain